jgi:hypothetical protein
MAKISTIIGLIILISNAVALASFSIDRSPVQHHFKIGATSVLSAGQNDEPYSQSFVDSEIIWRLYNCLPEDLFADLRSRLDDCTPSEDESDGESAVVTKRKPWGGEAAQTEKREANNVDSELCKFVGLSNNNRRSEITDVLNVLRTILKSKQQQIVYKLMEKMYSAKHE